MSRYILSLLLLGTLSVDAAPRTNSTSDRESCPVPFVSIADRCIHIDFAYHGTWNTMNTYCSVLGSGLVTVDDPNFFAELVLYINNIGWGDGMYWIGASDENQEAHWLWRNGSPVKMGTPFWSTFGCYNQQYPDGGLNENCAILDGNVNLFFNDFDCDDTTHNIYGICEK